MTFCLDTKLIKPESGKEIKNIIILLHGYGGDGNDIAQVTLNWKRFLPNTLFVCPNAPEKCLISPSGYQWFDLSKDNDEFILNESKKNEIIFSPRNDIIVEIETVEDMDETANKKCKEGCNLCYNGCDLFFTGVHFVCSFINHYMNRLATKLKKMF